MPDILAPDRESDVDARLLPLVVACVLLGAAVWTANGLYSRPAVALLLLALVAFAHALLLTGKIPAILARVAFGAGVLTQGTLLLLSPPLNDTPDPSHVWVHYTAWGVTILAGVGVASLHQLTRRSAPMLLGLMLAGAATGGIWAIVQNPSPRVDVFLYQQHASAALLQGINPYTLTFPNPYTPEESWVFAPGTVTADRILFGFPYLPGTLLLSLPAYALFGDYRVGQLLAVLGAAALLARAGGYSRQSLLTAALLLTWPRLPWVIEWGWSEPTIALLLVWTLAPHRRRFTHPLATALLLAAKQYVPLTTPALLAALWRRRPPTPQGSHDPSRAVSTPTPPAPSADAQTSAADPGPVRGGGVAPMIAPALALMLAAAVTLPLALWDFRAFWSSAVTLQLAQPFRPDALSLTSLIYDLTARRLPELTGVGLCVAGSILLPLRKHPLAWTLAVTLTLLFVLSKQAFANYYFLLATAWLIPTTPAPSTPSPGPGRV